ncbi:MAG: Asp-tRNA(Asn)/Glu-tRNA(Gln) amidotransferase GatCAB subunit B, partial [Firmicutes bacterium]|nr:Asp-tRNA(Asn)/Glu-tRNA(Gln) amidotransferase GatCAB subunit B [Bacillota bacterium]
LGTRAELKNMSSFKAIRKAIEYESCRQKNILLGGGKIIQETRRWDEAKEESYTMRSKENARDYRYFPEPDLLPIDITDDMIEEIRNSMPELPDKKRERYINEYGLSSYDASVITSERKLSFIFEKAAAVCGKPKEVCNMITGEMMRLISETGQNCDDVTTDPEKIAALVNMISDGKINRTVGKEVFEEIFRNDADPEKYVREKGLMMIEDTSLIENTIKDILEKNQKSVEDIKNGKNKAFSFLVGESMKALKGKANPKTVNDILKKLLIK